MNFFYNKNRFFHNKDEKDFLQISFKMQEMKTTLLISIIAGTGITILVSTSVFYIITKDTCRDLGGMLVDWNECKIVRSIGIPPPCDPGPVLDVDGYCYKNGMKITVSDVLLDNSVEELG